MLEETGKMEAIEKIKEMALDAIRPELHQMSGYDEKSTPYMILPEGVKPRDMTDMIPEKPRRKTANVKLNDVESFVGYVNEHKSKHSRIFAVIDQQGAHFAAIIDYHETGAEGKADWMSHTVELTLRNSPQYEIWSGRSNKFMTQEEFIEFLEEVTPDIVEPDAAEMLEIAHTLKLTIGGKCVNRQNLQDGSVFLEFKKDIEARAGDDKDIKIPERVKIGIPVFMNGTKHPIEAAFRYRQEGPNIKFGFKLIRTRILIENTIKSTIEHISGKCKLPVFHGRVS